MTEDLSSWLRLREPADTSARSVDVTRTIADTMAPDEPVHVLDLATGTGSNLRYLVAHLPTLQRWLAVDRDEALLERLPTLMSSWGASRGYEVRTDSDRCVIRKERLECHVETRRMDLGDLNALEIFAGRHLVTASALLDLVSAQWLRALAFRCRAVGATALFTINYNGRSSCAPAEPEDDMVRELLNRHQLRDKGLGGPAAGPDAAEFAAQCFSELGYRVRTEPSDWTLGSAEHDLQRALIEGWAHAASETMPGDSAVIASWRARRLAHVDAGRSQVVVGHDDVAAWLPRG